MHARSAHVHITLDALKAHFLGCIYRQKNGSKITDDEKGKSYETFLQIDKKKSTKWQSRATTLDLVNSNENTLRQVTKNKY